MRGLHHFGVTVKDLDASLRFYHDVLGLEIVSEPSPWFDSPELGPAVGVPGAALRQVCLKVGTSTLELLEYRSPPSETSRPLPSNNISASHVAFVVEDIEAAKAELEAKGIEFFSDVNVVDEGVLAGWRWVYFADPDGYPLELVEVAYRDEEARAKGIEAYLASRAPVPAPITGR
jgi:catechol 2,3-dioxygenase-like lactoylglutathione lyase family enzyme